MRGIHRWPVNSPHKGPVTRKMLPFDGVIMRSALVHVMVWTNVHSLLIGPFIINKTYNSSFLKMYLKKSSVKLRTFCLGGNELNCFHSLYSIRVTTIPSNRDDPWLIWRVYKRHTLCSRYISGCHTSSCKWTVVPAPLIQEARGCKHRPHSRQVSVPDLTVL